MSTIYSPPKKTRTRLGLGSICGRCVKGNFRVGMGIIAAGAMVDGQIEEQVDEVGGSVGRGIGC